VDGWSTTLSNRLYRVCYCWLHRDGIFYCSSRANTARKPLTNVILNPDKCHQNNHRRDRNWFYDQIHPFLSDFTPVCDPKVLFCDRKFWICNLLATPPIVTIILVMCLDIVLAEVQRVYFFICNRRCTTWYR
jgi:hypothetical protein